MINLDFRSSQCILETILVIKQQSHGWISSRKCLWDEISVRSQLRCSVWRRSLQRYMCCGGKHLLRKAKFTSLSEAREAQCGTPTCWTTSAEPTSIHTISDGKNKHKHRGIRLVLRKVTLSISLVGDRRVVSSMGLSLILNLYNNFSETKLEKKSVLATQYPSSHDKLGFS